MAATTTWWNGVLDRRGRLEKLGYPRYTDDRRANLQRLVHPENRDALTRVSDECLPAAAPMRGMVALAYGFALTLALGADPGDPGEWERGLVFDEEMLNELDRVYSPFADHYGYGTAVPFWRSARLAFGTYLVDSGEWAYRDQVGRWDAASGIPLSETITADPDRGFRASDVAWETGGRFFDAERSYPLRSRF